MTIPASSRVTINGAPLPFIQGAAVTIRYAPGVNWQTFNVVAGVGDEFDKAMQKVKGDGEVKIEIECADETVSGKSNITLKKWYLTARRERGDGFVDFQFADVRWRRNFAKLTASFNIVSYGGRYRKDSLYQGASPWPVWRACIEAFERLGYDPVDEIDDANCKRPLLPDNMSNTRGGGFAAASQGYALPPMMEAAALSAVPTWEGQLALTDRHSERSKDLKKYLMHAGGVDEADIHWQMPANVVVPFGRRIERLGSFNESATATSSGPTEYDVPVENVIPRWIPGQSLSVEDHQEIEAYLRVRAAEGNFPGGLAHVRKHYLHKKMYDAYNPNITAQLAATMDVIEHLVRGSYRRRLRFKTPDLSRNGKVTDELRARYADLELGRLKQDGTTRKDAVFCDYVRDDRFGRLRTRNGNALDQIFSDNVPFSTGSAAPFTAEWLPGGREGLIFELIPDTPDQIGTVGYIPGRLNKDKRYNNFAAVVAGTASLELDDTVELTGNFKVEFFYHGLWIHDGDGDLARTYEVKLPSGLQNPGVDEVTTDLVQDMTANYSYTGRFPGRLLNRDDLKVRAEQVRTEYVQSYMQGRAGISRHAGIDVLTKGGVKVGGDIAAIDIVIGARGVGSIETVVHVMPGKRPDVEPVFTGPKPISEHPARIL